MGLCWCIIFLFQSPNLGSNLLAARMYGMPFSRKLNGWHSNRYNWCGFTLPHPKVVVVTSRENFWPQDCEVNTGGTCKYLWCWHGRGAKPFRKNKNQKSYNGKQHGRFRKVKIQVSGEEHLSQFWKKNSFDQPTAYIVHHTRASSDLTWNWGVGGITAILWKIRLKRPGMVLEVGGHWTISCRYGRSHSLHWWQMPVQRRLLPEGSCRSVLHSQSIPILED